MVFFVLKLNKQCEGGMSCQRKDGAIKTNDYLNWARISTLQCIIFSRSCFQFSFNMRWGRTIQLLNSIFNLKLKSFQTWNSARNELSILRYWSHYQKEKLILAIRLLLLFSTHTLIFTFVGENTRIKSRLNFPISSQLRVQLAI